MSGSCIICEVAPPMTGNVVCETCSDGKYEAPEDPMVEYVEFKTCPKEKCSIGWYGKEKCPTCGRIPEERASSEGSIEREADADVGRPRDGFDERSSGRNSTLGDFS